MTNSPESDWRALCRQLAIDPVEVRLVHERYEAYRRFNEDGVGDAIPLHQWFRFYHREKTSEGIQAGAPVEGCSADGDAVNNACLERPAEFLRVLLAYDLGRSSAGGADA